MRTRLRSDPVPLGFDDAQRLQAALGRDLIGLLDGLRIETAIVAGFDWGGLATCVAIALWPERVAGLVSLASYAVADVDRQGHAFPLSLECVMWYQHLFQTNRGRECLDRHRRDLCRILWEQWSPGWRFDAATFDRTAASFDNPDFVDVVIHCYRFHFGLTEGEPALAELENRLAAKPKIVVPFDLHHCLGRSSTIEVIEDNPTIPGLPYTSVEDMMQGESELHESVAREVVANYLEQQEAEVSEEQRPMVRAFEDGVLLDLDIGKKSWKERLNPSDVGLTEFPENFTPGQRRLLPEEPLAAIDRIESAARRHVDKNAFRFGGSTTKSAELKKETDNGRAGRGRIRFIRNKHVADILIQLDDYKCQYYAAVDAMIANYEEHKAKMQEDFPNQWPYIADKYRTCRISGIITTSRSRCTRWSCRGSLAIWAFPPTSSGRTPMLNTVTGLPACYRISRIRPAARCSSSWRNRSGHSW